MADIATSVRVSGEQPEETIFWRDVRQAYARLAADPKERAEQKAAFDVWDKGTAKDYRESEWS